MIEILKKYIKPLFAVFSLIVFFAGVILMLPYDNKIWLLVFPLIIVYLITLYQLNTTKAFRFWMSYGMLMLYGLMVMVIQAVYGLMPGAQVF